MENLTMYLKTVIVDKVKRNRKSQVEIDIVNTVSMLISQNKATTVKAISEILECKIQYIHLLAKKSKLITKYEHNGNCIILPLIDTMTKDYTTGYSIING